MSVYPGFDPFGYARLVSAYLGWALVVAAVLYYGMNRGRS